MTAKEYLSQAYHLDQRINSKIVQVFSLNDLAQKCTSVISGMPHNPSGSSSQMADTISKIVDLQAEINRDIDALVDLKQKIVTSIKAVDNPEYQFLLEQRYLSFEPWERIAVNMGYSLQHTFRLHDRALRKISVPDKR